MTTLGPSLTVVGVRLDDPLASDLLDELFHEYSTRYPDVAGHDEAHAAAFRVQHLDEFVPPDGDLVLLLADGYPVAGGAFRRRTEPEAGDPARRSASLAHAGSHADDGSPLVRTAELKRIWTRSGYRRQGLARRVVAELEARAAARGYVRVYLTTGPRQPEAEALYVTVGYTQLYDAEAVAASGELGPRPFEKWLRPA